MYVLLPATLGPRPNNVKVPIKWESVDVTPRLVDGKTVIPDESIASVTRNYVALKGPLAVRAINRGFCET